MKAGLNTLNPSFIFAAKIKVTLKNPQILTDRMDVLEHEHYDHKNFAHKLQSVLLILRASWPGGASWARVSLGRTSFGLGG